MDDDCDLKPLIGRLIVADELNNLSAYLDHLDGAVLSMTRALLLTPNWLKVEMLEHGAHLIHQWDQEEETLTPEQETEYEEVLKTFEVLKEQL